MHQIRNPNRGNSLAVQCLRLHASTEGGMGLISGQGTKIPKVLRHRQNKQKNPTKQKRIIMEIRKHLK